MTSLEAPAWFSRFWMSSRDDSHSVSSFTDQLCSYLEDGREDGNLEDGLAALQARGAAKVLEEELLAQSPALANPDGYASYGDWTQGTLGNDKESHAEVHRKVSEQGCTGRSLGHFNGHRTREIGEALTRSTSSGLSDFKGERSLLQSREWLSLLKQPKPK